MADTSLFPALGPMGSVITSVVVAAGAAGAGYLAHAGIIQGTDQSVVAGVIVSILVSLGGIAYKAISSRMAAKVTAVAAEPGHTVVVPPEVKALPDHADDSSVITPQKAAIRFAP